MGARGDGHGGGGGGAAGQVIMYCHGERGIRRRMTKRWKDECSIVDVQVVLAVTRVVAAPSCDWLESNLNPRKSHRTTRHDLLSSTPRIISKTHETGLVRLIKPITANDWTSAAPGVEPFQLRTDRTFRTRHHHQRSHLVNDARMLLDNRNP